MKIRALVIVSIMLLFTFKGFAQVVNGTIVDNKGTPIFAATVLLKSNPNIGVQTDFNGNFEIKVENINTEILIVSSLGYEKKEISLSDYENTILIQLAESYMSIAEVVIIGENPISKQFAVSIISPMDIYLNPLSQGDPLKAITALASSTTIDETANPSLRGSSGDSSIVSLNGVPVYNPVRSSQLNNQGFFSLFSPEIIDNQYVYAGNPPLTFGNTSAGLVEIHTQNNLKDNQLQLSLSLAGTGAMVSQRINKDKTFIQAFFNYQFSDYLTGIQKASYPDIKRFSAKDGGINFYSRIGEKIEFKSYVYLIDEQFSGSSYSDTYYGEVETESKRLININSLRYFTGTNIFSLNTGISKTTPKMAYGNMSSKGSNSQLYSAFNYKKIVSHSIQIQSGLSYENNKYKLDDTVPIYYYALTPESPSYHTDEVEENNMLELYLYPTWDINQNFTLSAGLRSNIPLDDQKHYLSSQVGFKYKTKNNQEFTFGAGKYHSYSVPSYYSQKFNLLSSYQVSLDYSYERNNSKIKAATYYKKEKGIQTFESLLYESISLADLFGLEFFFEHNFQRYFKFSFSNSFINQKTTINNEKRTGPKSLNYFVKSSIEYNNSKLFTMSLSLISRPGSLYHSIIGSSFDNNANAYKPFYGDWYGSRYNSYNRFDLTVNKYIPMNKYSMAIFVSLNNVFNTKNEESDTYNIDYSKKSFSLYQQRSLYFGIVFYLNYRTARS